MGKRLKYEVGRGTGAKKFLKGVRFLGSNKENCEGKEGVRRSPLFVLAVLFVKKAVS
jgi:hypothetical protein